MIFGAVLTFETQGSSAITFHQLRNIFKLCSGVDVSVATMTNLIINLLLFQVSRTENTA